MDIIALNNLICYAVSTVNLVFTKCLNLLRINNIMKMKEHFAANKSKISVILLFLFLTMTFVVSFKTKFNVHYDRLFGWHSWLSGSIIKFVNNWLIETPQKLCFVNYENPNSIEFNDLTEREPYISYPSGCTFFVYIFAKLLGRQTIDISFLKHLQMICFWLETLLLALFVYRFLKNIGIKSETEKTITAFLTALFWSWIPTNVWYLANVFFSDQCVILFIMAFLYIEFESYCCKSNSLNLILNLIKVLLILAGVLIDYYFWIFIFVAFVLKIIYSIKNKKTLVIIIRDSLWYVIPVFFAVSVFLCQIVSVSNWQNTLKATFLDRIGATQSECSTMKYIVTQLCKYFIDAFGLETNLKLLVLLLIILCFHSGNTKASKDLITSLKESAFSTSGIILILGTISPILQILFLKNHSAVHEFSETKLSWIVAMIPVIVSVIYYKTHKDNGQLTLFSKINVSPFLKYFMISFLCIVFITGVPFSSKEYKDKHEIEVYDYHLAEILRENTTYEHVCFSFSYFIPFNPPQELSVSQKRVYKIDTETEMNTMFPNLNQQALKLFIIDKNAVSELTEEQIEVQNNLNNSNKVFFEDERFCILELAK